MSKQRLNPKLTRRGRVGFGGPADTFSSSIPDSARSASSNASSVEASEALSINSSSCSASESDIGNESGSIPTHKPNPRIHLLHNGTWITKKFEVGRPVPRTGVWDCCGDPEHLSMYCESLEARDIYKQKLRLEDDVLAAELERTSKTREYLANHIKQAETRPKTDLFPIPPTAEEAAVAEAGSHEGAFNAPVLIAWLLTHYEEEPTAISGLRFVLKHLQSGEGCYLMARHGLVSAIDKIHCFYRGESEIQLLCLNALKQLLDCNFTRNELLEDLHSMRIAFSIARTYMNSVDHVEVAVGCLAQCARGERNRVEMLKQHVVPNLIQFCRLHSRSIPVVRGTMQLMNWISSNRERMKYITDVKGVHAALQCLKRHYTTPLNPVLPPIILFLSRMAANVPVALELILRKQTVTATVVKVLQSEFNNDAIQLGALRLLQVIAKTTAGWNQIEAINGGWQIICQGTTEGDTLIHRLPGALQNPGWAIGDTRYLTLPDRMKQAAAKLAQNELRQEPKAGWTASSLREFMGLSMAGQTLAINTEQPEVFFELCSTLDVLPKSDEGRELWFQRVIAFEKENEVKIEEMVETVIQMRRRDALHKKMQAKNMATSAFSDDVLGTVKEVYVKGERVTGEILEQKDADVDEALEGII